MTESVERTQDDATDGSHRGRGTSRSKVSKLVELENFGGNSHDAYPALSLFHNTSCV